MAEEALVSGLQLDLVTVVARLRQVKRAVDDGGSGFYGDDCSVVFERIFTCDLPRLEGHLTAEARELLARAEE